MKKITLAIYISLIFIVNGFAKEYSRIISLVPSFTQNIYDLDAQKKLIGCTSYCKSAEGDNKEIVASAIKANVEKIISLKPDLVLASGLTNPKDIAAIEKTGIHVEVMYSPKTYADICSQFILLGKMVGKQELANHIVDKSNKQIKIFQENNKRKNKPKIFFQIGANPIFAVLKNTFMDDYITLCGATNVANGLKHGTVSREMVLTKNPDYIFIATMGIVGDQEKKNWEKYKFMNAVKNKKIIIIDSQIACVPTPKTFMQTLEIINNTLK